ncbi:hypothetical protein TWF569_002140 [Orbilia oligospora]|uniref:KOW domain-containing protein n=1 Tax=Orbilia oligospora TaxID=2813651 RepID=A0A7C8NLQ9_ORBOL|nr:hypothetical protein TWF103_002566 [Orbilia oligospora]KAF3093087.1 hypothetical protein TWF102_008025 [Orbilia oligospora]KAF3108389.1 hypothetical protein TWF706_002266 [Orbilia oligospora]KAF3122610.1 hypothetical protein TWF569_002140 [Orbilia oligospora]KAF3127701.1 hypothetical protein TWF594_000628 [Orbilia oligospora]
MSQTKVVSSQWPQVETGRVVLINSGKDEGKLAAVVQIIDHKRALVDSPHIERQEISLSHVSLTHQVITKLPRAARSGVVKKYWAEASIDDKTASTTWAKKRASREKKRQLTDFERFKVMVLKKQVSIRDTLGRIFLKDVLPIPNGCGHSS